MVRYSVVVFLSLSMTVAGQQGNCCRHGSHDESYAASGKLVELRGTVLQIQIVRGKGMPYLELQHGQASTRIYLGPMPFLVGYNVNPKKGQAIVVRGYKFESGVIAAQLTFVAEKRTIKFRDEHGWPLWRGAFSRGKGSTR